MATSAALICFPFLAAALTLAGGCTAVPEDAGFTEVRQQTSLRVPGSDVRWNRNGAADLAASLAVDQLLARPLTPDAAVQVALLSNRRLQATYEDLMVAQADLVAAGLLRNPVFDAELKVPVAGSGGMGVELQVVQEFIRIFQIPLRKKLAAVQFTAARQRVTGAAVALAGDTRRAYADALSASARLTAATQLISDLEAFSRSKSRLAPELSNRIQTEVLQARLGRAEATLAAAQARETLAGILGLWGRNANRLILPIALPELPKSEWTPDSVERAALMNSLDLAQARQSILLSASALGLSDSQFNLGVNAERYPDSGTWAVGPTLAIPIPIFDNGQPEQAAKAAELRRAQATYHAQAVELRSAVHLAQNELAGTRAAAEFERIQLLPAQAALAEASQALAGAKSTPTEVDLALRTLLALATARERHIARLNAYWRARETIVEIVAGHLPSGREPATLPHSVTFARAR